MFKVGDKVRCIDADGLIYIKEENIYEVAEVLPNYIYITGVSWYSKSRFEKVESELKLTKTVTKTEINWVKDARDRNHALISLQPWDSGVRLVIGARYENENSPCFTKDSLTDLINELTAVRDAL